jgi:hypothetical protein
VSEVLRLLGLSKDEAGEGVISTALAVLLMAALGALFYLASHAVARWIGG